MTLDQKRWVIGGLGFLFLLSLVAVQWLEVSRRRHEESGGRAGASAVSVPDASRQCVDCHTQVSTGIVDHWKGSTHAEKGVACLDCHKAGDKDADMFSHYGRQIATIVTPRDCASCHPTESAEFAVSHHSKAGNILASLDNFLAETGRGIARAVQSAFAHAGQGRQRGERHGAGQLGLPAVSRLARRLPGQRRRPGDHARPEARRQGPADQPRRRRPHRPQRERQAAVQQHQLAQHRHWPPQPGRLAGILRRLPQPPRLLGPPRAPARELRQVPPGPRSSAEGDLRRVEARRGVPRSDWADEPRRQAVGGGQGLQRGADLRDLPHERQHAERDEDHPRSGRAHLVDQSAAGQPGDGHRRQPRRGHRDRSRRSGAPPLPTPPTPSAIA